MREKIIAVIPAYNEEHTIGDVIRAVKKYVDEIIVTDDASTDKTGKIAAELSATVVTHTTNLGYDKSLDDGFKEAAKQGATILFTFDADGQHVAEDIPVLLAPILSHTADVVVGVRPWRTRFAETAFAWYAKRKIGIHDPLCGMKAYTIQAYASVEYFDRLQSIGTELLFNCAKRRYRIVETPIHLNKREGHPRFGSRIKGNWRIFIALIRISRQFRTMKKYHG